MNKLTKIHPLFSYKKNWLWRCLLILTTISSFNLLPKTTLAQELQGCYMFDETGEFIDLTPLCPYGSQEVFVPEASEPVLGTGDVQVTLRWQTVDDLDLAVVDPSGERADYTNTRVTSGGELDVDSNAGCGENNTSPVENIFWPTGGGATGDYTVEVNLFSRCTGSSEPIAFTLKLLVDGQVQEFSQAVSDAQPTLSFPFTFVGR